MIALTKPLVFFDLETTGVDPFNDRIVQIGALRFEPGKSAAEKEWLINPGIPIPGIVTNIHGITDEMVKDKPRLGDLAAELSDFFLDADLGGYNIKNFDVPMLQSEFSRIGLSLDIENTAMLDAMQIFRIKEPRTLAAAYKKYCNKELKDAHNAIADIRASVDVFEAQLNTYDDLPSSANELHEYCFPTDPDAYDAEGKLKFFGDVLTINFGKNRGKPLHELALSDPGYLEWILNGSFSHKVKSAVSKALGR